MAIRLVLGNGQWANDPPANCHQLSNSQGLGLRVGVGMLARPKGWSNSHGVRPKGWSRVLDRPKGWSRDGIGIGMA